MDKLIQIDKPLGQSYRLFPYLETTVINVKCPHCNIIVMKPTGKASQLLPSSRSLHESIGRNYNNIFVKITKDLSVCKTCFETAITNSTNKEEEEKIIQKHREKKAKSYFKHAQKSKHEPVWITFNKDLKILAENCPSALITLKIASWLDIPVIPESLLKSVLERILNEPVHVSLWNKIKAYIARHSLMRIDNDGSRFRMHPLLKDIIRSQQNKLEIVTILRYVTIE